MINMARKSGRHKMRVVQMGMPMGYPSPYYPPQQVVYVERPVKKKKPKKRHKRKAKPKDAFEQYEAEVKAMEQFMPEAPEIEEEKPRRHKRKRRPTHEEELESLEEWMAFTEAPTRVGKHKVRKVEPLWITPEDIPEEEEEDWMKRQQEQWKRQQEEFIKMAESGKKFAEGSYRTFTEAKRKARKLSRGLKSAYHSLRRRLGLKVPKRPPVQVFIEPTAEGDYVVYGQVKRTEVPVARPTRPIKVFVPPPEEEEIRYEELMS